jgi:hypothetical protein
MYCRCRLVIRVPGYRSRGSGFDYRCYQIFWVAVGLERGPLSLVRINEERLKEKVAAPVCRNEINGRSDPLRWPRPLKRKVGTSFTGSGGRSISIVGFRPKGYGVCLFCFIISVLPNKKQKSKLRGIKSTSELYRLSDRHLLTKFDANFCGYRGVAWSPTILRNSHCFVLVIINTALLLGAPMLSTWWVKISTYFQLEQFLSMIFALKIVNGIELNYYCYMLVAYRNDWTVFLKELGKGRFCGNGSL